MVKTGIFDRIARHYDFLTKILMLGTYERVRERIVALKENENDNLVLDIASGTGYVISKIKAKKIVALDLSAGMLKINKKKHAKMKNLSLIRASVFAMPFKDNSFDTVYFATASHEFANLNPIFREVKRVLRDKGNFIIWDIYNPSFLPAKFYINVIVKYIAEMGKMRVYTKEEWQNILEKAGFKVINLEELYKTSILIKAEVSKNGKEKSS